MPCGAGRRAVLGRDSSTCKSTSTGLSPYKRRSAGKHGVEQCAEGIDVGRFADIILFASGLFGGM